MADRYSTSDFDYAYPPEAIAQQPMPDRSKSRLLVLDRTTGRSNHTTFESFSKLPSPGDVLIVNATRVIRARLRGRRENGREAEVLLTRRVENDTWLAMVHPGGKLKVGRRVMLGEDTVAEIVEVIGGGLRRVRFSGPIDVNQLMEREGSTPLPPYISRAPTEVDDRRYQTIFAREDGSVAAPTAGLHFTPKILQELSQRHVSVVEIVLHIGPGTFKPVEGEDPAEHRMHEEWFSVSGETVTAIRQAKEGGKRIWAVGTTSARVLETIARRDRLEATTGWTRLFIYPPFEFRIVDALVTNFHLPRSTLLMLVSAFAGHQATMQAYRQAIAMGYRLYSYGDAMVVV